MTVSSSEADEAFLSRYDVATLSTIRPDGAPHVVPVRFTWDTKGGLARVMTRREPRGP